MTNINSETAKKIKAGDMLVPDETWNRTSAPRNKLPVPAEVLAVREAICQSGRLLTVRSVSGDERELSASWFLDPEAGGK
jgi:hypothetical protein